MNIYEKIAKVMEDVQYLSKDDRVKFKETNYKAISEEKVTSAVREKLVKQKLVILPIEQFHKREGNLTTVDVKYRIVNAENPDEYVDVVSSGTGADSQDKGVGKAMTYAYKYMLLRTFAIPTGEDPDKISSEEISQKETERAAAELAESLMTITAEQVAKLEKCIPEHNQTVEKVCKVFGVESLSQLQRGQYDVLLKKMGESG